MNILCHSPDIYLYFDALLVNEIHSQSIILHYTGASEADCIIHEVLLGDIERLADHIPSGTMVEIAIKHLGLVMTEIEHCRETALTKSNVSWYHTLFCLLLWREKEENFGSRQRLYYHLTKASEQGLLSGSVFQFLKDQV